MSPSTHPTNAAHADSAEPSLPVWFDAHNHLHDPRFGTAPEEIVAAQRAAGVRGCVVNATCEDDWPQVAALADRFPDFIRPAFGIHPWKAHTVCDGWQSRLIELLESSPTALIGECGIDSWINAPALDVQTPVFLDHLRIARQTNRTPTIHCLKAWGRLFDCFEKEAPPPRFLMHSYSGSLETALRLVPLGAYFSFSGHFLHERKHAALSVFRNLPLERILLETDAPDMMPPTDLATHPLPTGLNHPANLHAIGTALAARMGMTPDALAQLMAANMRRCFDDA